MSSAIAHHLVGRRHLEVQGHRQLGLEPAHVVVANMATVLTQVRGDAVGAGVDGEAGGADRVRQGATPCVAHGSDVVDVDAEAQPAHPFTRSSLADDRPRPQLRDDRAEVLEVADLDVGDHEAGIAARSAS